MATPSSTLLVRFVHLSAGLPAVEVGEFFAGIGLAKMGLEQAGFKVRWSNDISAKKKRMFETNYGVDSGTHTYDLRDVREVGVEALGGRFSAAWASFPCKDLSLAGGRGGLHVGSSSAFWSFVQVLSEMKQTRPRVIVIENVTAFATSRLGKDLFAAIRALNGLGYSVDIINLDARRFVPQSRPRLFLIADREGKGDDAGEDTGDNEIRPSWLDVFHSDSRLRTHRANLPTPPPLMNSGFTKIADSLPADHAAWWNEERLNQFLTSLTDIQHDRLDRLRNAPVTSRRTAFRRMRAGLPRWEVRADDIAGCLRTSSGGSSRQAVVELGFGDVRARWMTPHEYAKLMGAESYEFSGLSVGDVLTGFGDAVCVPVVRWIGEAYLQPLFAVDVEKRPSLEEAVCGQP